MQDIASQVMFEIFDMEPVVEAGTITNTEIELIDNTFSKMPYLGRLIEKFIIADNIFPAEGPFADVGSGNNWFQGLFEPIYGKGNLYIFRPQCINFSPVAGTCSLKTPFIVPSKTLYGAHLDEIMFGEMYQAVILHELGHAIENSGLSTLNKEGEEYDSSVKDWNRLFGINNPIMAGFLRSWDAILPSEQDLQNFQRRKITRGTITYSMLTHETAQIEGEGWKYSAAMDCPVPNYLARFGAVPSDDLSTFPIRTLFGPTTESWADFWMMRHLGQPFTPNTQKIAEYIDNIDAAFRDRKESEYITQISKENKPFGV